jgi:hypothetical protein
MLTPLIAVIDMIARTSFGPMSSKLLDSLAWFVASLRNAAAGVTMAGVWGDTRCWNRFSAKAVL